MLRCCNVVSVSKRFRSKFPITCFKLGLTSAGILVVPAELDLLSAVSGRAFPDCCYCHHCLPHSPLHYPPANLFHSIDLPIYHLSSRKVSIESSFRTQCTHLQKASAHHKAREETRTGTDRLHKLFGEYGQMHIDSTEYTLSTRLQI